MAVMALDCPHCGTENVSFDVVGERHFLANRWHWLVFLICAKCEQGVIARVAGVNDRGAGNHGTSPGTYAHDPRNDGYKLIATWPQAEQLKAPAHTPGHVARFYIQAEDNLRRGNWDAAGGMYRSALDVGTSALDASLTGRLVKRIDKLAGNLAITPAMREWAHKIRLGGNVALHEEEPFSEAEATALKTFTELFLTYAFMLPGMLEERRTEAAAEAAEAPTEAEAD